MPFQLDSFLNDLPKAELHVHLEGSIQPETLLLLAERHGRLGDLPGTDVSKLREWFRFRDFNHFLEIYFFIQSLLKTADDLALVTYECGADMACQTIRYREVTFTPYLHVFQNKGLSIEEMLEGLEEGRQRALRDFDVHIRWVFDIPRNMGFDGSGNYVAEAANKTLDYALAGRDIGVVGLGLGGGEASAPPEPFTHAFELAKSEGLISVPHAGEVAGPPSVWGAIRNLKADRIGHGVRSIEDPSLLTYLIEEEIPLEVSPTSNICLGVYANIADHPFQKLDEMGLLVTVNSDDPPLFDCSLLSEYKLLANEFGYGKEDLLGIARNAFAVSGAEESLKKTLLDDFDQWSKPSR